MKKLILLGVLGLAGCVSVEDIRSYEPADQHVVAEDFAELAACMADAYLVETGFNITPIVSARQRRATVLIAAVGYAQTLPLAEVEVAATGPTSSRVTYRKRKTAFGTDAMVQQFRKLLADCVPGWAPPSA